MGEAPTAHLSSAVKTVYPGAHTHTTLFPTIIQVTSHREDWEACAGKNPEFISRTFTAYISSSTGMDDVCSRTESDDENTDLAQVSSGGDRSEVCTTGTQGKHETWRPPPSEEAALDRLGADTLCQTIVNSIKIRQEGRGVRITLRSPRSGRETAGSGWETGLDDNMEETGALDRTFGGDGSGGGGGRPVTVDSDDIDKPTKVRASEIHALSAKLGSSSFWVRFVGEVS